jgi:DNA-directed RNA polymerase specialized sigma24 family protein
MADNDPADGELLGRAGSNPEAASRLFARYRQRLLRMVAVRMDRRLARRVDASDVVQEGFAEAARKLPEYLGRPEAPFYPWLRQIVWRRLMDLYRRHVLAQTIDGLRQLSGLTPKADQDQALPASQMVRDLTSGYLGSSMQEASGDDPTTDLGTRPQEPAPPAADGRVLAQVEKVAMAQGRELTRKSLEAVLNDQAQEVEKKGRPVERAPAADRHTTGGDNLGRC